MKYLYATLFCTTFSVACSSIAETPVQNVDMQRHPNLAEAQALIVRATEKLDAAQRANDDQMGGHAQQAKNMLMQASEQIGYAARAANRR